MNFYKKLKNTGKALLVGGGLLALMGCSSDKPRDILLASADLDGDHGKARIELIKEVVRQGGDINRIDIYDSEGILKATFPVRLSKGSMMFVDREEEGHPYSLQLFKDNQLSNLSYTATKDQK